MMMQKVMAIMKLEAVTMKKSNWKLKIKLIIIMKKVLVRMSKMKSM